MTTMIEKVARAICQAWGYDPDGNHSWHTPPADAQGNLKGEFFDPSWHGFVPHARQSVAAMRDPTEAVIIAGVDAGEEGFFASQWAAAIDAALAEGK